MRDNKFYKVLRIVFLTLAIISLVFTLCKKIGLCASDSSSSGVKTLPFRVGAGYCNNFSQSQLDVIHSILLNEASDEGYSLAYSLLISDSESYITIYSFSDYNNTGFLYSGNDSSFPLSGSFRFKYVSPSGYAGYNLISINKSTFTLNRSYWVTGSSGVYNTLGSSFTTANPDGSYSQIMNSVVEGSPIYISHDLSYNDVLYFSTSNSGDGSLSDPDVDWGAIDQVLDTTQLIADTVDSTWSNLTFWQRILLTLTQGFNNIVNIGQWMLNNLLSFFKPVFDSILNVLQWFVSFFNNLFSVLQTFFSSILDSVENGFLSVVSSITTLQNNVVNGFSAITSSISGFFSGLFDNISGFFSHLHEIYEWFYNHGLDSDNEWSFMVLFHYLFDFDTQTALSDFRSNKYGDFILDVRDFGSTLYNSIMGATASEHVFFTISLGNHFGVQIPDIMIDFDWYAQIRDSFLPYLMAFIYVSAIWLFIKRLPDIIHGVASAESSFTDSLPRPDFDTYTETHVSGGTYFSSGHISGDGRNRVYHNWFKKN